MAINDAIRNLSQVLAGDTPLQKPLVPMTEEDAVRELTEVVKDRPAPSGGGGMETITASWGIPDYVEGLVILNIPSADLLTEPCFVEIPIKPSLDNGYIYSDKLIEGVYVIALVTTYSVVINAAQSQNMGLGVDSLILNCIYDDSEHVYTSAIGIEQGID